MEDGQRWGVVVNADKKVLEDSTEVERECNLLINSVDNDFIYTARHQPVICDSRRTVPS